MTAPSREPTEAMRRSADRIVLGAEWNDLAEYKRRLKREIARALLEQDAAARREGFEQAVAAMIAWHEQRKKARRLLGSQWMPFTNDDAIKVLRALTPEPPSERENEGG